MCFYPYFPVAVLLKLGCTLQLHQEFKCRALPDLIDLRWDLSIHSYTITGESGKPGWSQWSMAILHMQTEGPFTIVYVAHVRLLPSPPVVSVFAGKKKSPLSNGCHKDSHDLASVVCLSSSAKASSSWLYQSPPLVSSISLSITISNTLYHLVPSPGTFFPNSHKSCSITPFGPDYCSNTTLSAEPSVPSFLKQTLPLLSIALLWFIFLVSI